MTEVTWHTHSMHGEYTLQSQAFLMHHEVQPSRRRGSWVIVLGKEEFTSCLGLFFTAFLLEPRLCAYCWLPQAGPDPDSQRLVCAQNNTSTATWHSSSHHQKLPPRCTRGTEGGQRSPELSVQQTATRCPEQRMSFCKHSGSTPGVISVCLRTPGNLWRQLE